MGLLTDFEFKSEYHKLDDDVSKEFYIPCMSNSVEYKRISGYFGSTVFIVAWSALKSFINNDGHMKIICSPYLSEEDAQAIKNGLDAKSDEIITNSILAELEEMLEADSLSASAKLLMWMIASGVMEIRLAIGRDCKKTDPNIERLYHDKAGVFIDKNGNAVGFRGSFNETYKGLSNNGNIESADVFQSWDVGKDANRVRNINDNFDKVWNGYYDDLELCKIPDEAQKYIRKKADDYHWEELLDEVKVKIDRGERWKPNKTSDIIRLKDHQIDALEGWGKQNYRAIYQGCTGCGKTVISISAIRYAIDQGKTVLVLVPSRELLSGWYSEIKRIISDIDVSIFLCGDGNNSWKKENNLSLWTSESKDVKKIVLAMMNTASKEEFISKVSQGEHLFIVADEVHRMGSETRRRFFSVKNGATLGVSATPIRYGDQSGTDAIIEYFGNILIPPYTLKEALKDKVLTQYYYFPQSVKLTPLEQEAWNEITRKINKRIAISSSKGAFSMENDSFLSMMMIERARIIKKAANKIETARSVIQNNYKLGQRWLVYCEDKEQLHEVIVALDSLGVDVYEYYAGMPGDRERTLDYFKSNGGVIVSIKCLDEGVDIPATTHALVLASSKNPREFIQRRGRILRKAENKYFSFLYDAIVVPNSEGDAQIDKSLSVVVSELARAIEFGGLAENPACITDLKLIALRYNVDYIDFKNEGYEDDEE